MSVMLSKLGEVKSGLRDDVRAIRGLKGLIDPLPQVSMDKEVQAQQGDEVREAPRDAAAHLQISKRLAAISSPEFTERLPKGAPYHTASQKLRIGRE
jgi:hypothetical protein